MTMPLEKMKESAASYHTNAVNLARRWTVQNENDLLQVSAMSRTSLN